MHVKLISVTKPVIPILTTTAEIAGDLESYTEMTAEELLVYIARVSNPSNQSNVETAPKLIKYLIDHKHWSPFDMVNMTVEVKTSKAIAIQILRHWSIKPQEFSQRYAEVTEIEPIEIRRAAEKNRQSSEEEFNPTLTDNNGNWWGGAGELIEDHIERTMELYKSLLEAGVAKECARMILPMATSTTMYLNGSLRSWIHYLEQRLSPHAQKEHREVAKEIEKLFKEQFPNVAEALGI